MKNLCHETDLLASEIVDQTKQAIAGDIEVMEELSEQCVQWKFKVRYISSFVAVKHLVLMTVIIIMNEFL